MKTKLLILLVTSTLVGCELNNDPSKTSDDWINKTRPQTIFEGTWTWEETVGSGIAGPYRSDSISVGYALHYVFGFKELQTYEDGVKVENYTYTFNVSDNKENQKLNLRDNAGNEQHFLWEVKSDEIHTFLYLRNVEPCCDNTFERRFRLIVHGDTGKSK
jgi:hypothetical protein